MEEGEESVQQQHETVGDHPAMGHEGVVSQVGLASQEDVTSQEGVASLENVVSQEGVASQEGPLAVVKDRSCYVPSPPSSPDLSIIISPDQSPNHGGDEEATAMGGGGEGERGGGGGREKSEGSEGNREAEEGGREGGGEKSEGSGESEGNREAEEGGREGGGGLSLPLQFLFKAHDHLGKMGWCCKESGSFLIKSVMSLRDELQTLTRHPPKERDVSDNIPSLPLSLSLPPSLPPSLLLPLSFPSCRCCFKNWSSVITVSMVTLTKRQRSEVLLITAQNRYILVRTLIPVLRCHDMV